MSGVVERMDPRPVWTEREGASLFVGSAVEARDKALLKKLNVRFVVNAAKEIECFHRGEFEYLHFQHLDDDVDEPIGKLFGESSLFILKGLQNGGSVFVHCQAGISRSVTLCIAFLISEKKMTLRESFFRLKDVRPMAGM